MASYQSRGRDPLLDSTTQAAIEKRGRELFGFLLIAVGVLMVIMLVFAGLQYNDPDGLYWAIIYLLPAMALGLAAFVPHRFATLLARVLLFLAIVVLGFGVYVYWPSQLASFAVSEWWDEEPVKEGFGVAIAYLFTCLTIPLAFRQSVRRLKQNSSEEA